MEIRAFLVMLFLVQIEDNAGQPKSYRFSDYCPQGCRCKTSNDEYKSNYYHDMYVKHWLQKIYGSSEGKYGNTTGLGYGKEIMCLGLQELPNNLPSDLVKLQIYGGKQGLRRLRDGALYSDAPYNGMDNNLPLHYLQLTHIDKHAFHNTRSLTGLEISGNRIKILSNELVPLENLKSLSLKHNRIKIIEPYSLHGLRDLETIDLTGNHIMKIPKQVFNGAYKLKVLKLGKNKIGILGLHKETFLQLHALRTLDLSDNLLSNLHPDIFVRNTFLEDLDLSENKITAVDPAWFESMSKLKKLNLMGNNLIELSSISFKPLRLLSELNLAQNNITTIERNVFLPLPKLVKLVLSGNRIRYITSYTFADLSQLSELHLEENILENLANASFANLGKLTKLSLGRNRLKEISKHTYEPLKELRNLDISYNLIKSLKSHAFFGLYNVRELNLRNNDIGHIDEKAFAVSLMRHYSKVTWLSLQNNNIASISGEVFRSAPHIKYLDLDNNRITHIDDNAFKPLVSLNILKIRNNHVSELSDFVFRYQKRLQILDLASNKLLYLPADVFRGLEKVEEINLASNRLMSVPESVFNATPRLVHADLSGNRLARFPMRMFANNKYLRRINLSNSSINAIDAALNLVFKLDLLNIADNNLESLGPAIVTWLARNGTFQLAGNPWMCDCRLTWIIDAMQTGFFFVPDRDSVLCKRPFYSIGKQIATMSRSELPCDKREIQAPSEVPYKKGKETIPIRLNKMVCPPAEESRRRLPRPILEEWHATIFDRYKQPVCSGVHISDHFVITHATCWLNLTITADDVIAGKILVKTGGERDPQSAYNFRVTNIYFYPKMVVSARSEYRAIALVKIKSLNARSSSLYYPCINNPVNVHHKRLTYFLTTKLSDVRPATRVKLRTMTLRGHRQGFCDGVSYACTKSFLRRMPSKKYFTIGAPLYARDDLGLVGIRSMLESSHLQTFMGLYDLVPWMDHIIGNMKV